MPALGWALLIVLSTITFVVGLYVWVRTGQVTLFLSTVTLIVVGVIGYGRGRRVVYVSEDELRVIGRGATEETYPMSEIRAATWSGITGDITIRGVDGEVITVIPRRFLESHRLAKRVVQAIERARMKKGSGIFN